jgi:hypothetical protein
MKTAIVSTLAALALCATVAHAQERGEAVAYEGHDFEGRRMDLRDDVANFDRNGFNDRISSLRIVRGVWEFCTDAFYRGSCRTLGPGEYRDLGSQDNKISSARLVAAGRPGWGRNGGGWEPHSPQWSDVGHGDVQLFDGQGFHGFLANVEREAPNFQPLGLNDKVSSIIVRRGVWEFCTDAGFRGSCRTFPPGEYPDLGGQDNKFSSVRPVAAGPGRAPAGRTGLVLFDRDDFSGRSVWLEGPTANLEFLGFNDRARSIVIERGRWTLCTDANLRGRCSDFGPGRHVLSRELSGRISSAVPR